MPWLREHDRYSAYLESCFKHIRNQDCQVKIFPPFLTAPTTRRFEAGTPSLLMAITEKLNEIVEKYKKSRASHLWIVDSDIENPPHALCSLLEMDVDIAGGVYPFHNDKYCAMAGVIPDPHRFSFKPRKMGYIRGQILGENEFVAAGNGCMLIKRRVFQHDWDGYPPMKFYSENGEASDTLFWWMAQKRGFSCRVNGNVICGHLPQWALADIT